jgi:hypothetical protein
MRLLALLPLLLTACPSLTSLPLRQTADCPEGYVPVDRARCEFEGRAISAGGVVIAIRERKNDQQASTEFWTHVITKELTEVQGYAVRSSKELHGGRAILFAAPQERTTSYYVALFVTASRIVTVEIAGPQADVERDLPRLEEYIGTLKLS